MTVTGMLDRAWRVPRFDRSASIMISIIMAIGTYCTLSFFAPCLAWCDMRPCPFCHANELTAVGKRKGRYTDKVSRRDMQHPLA